MPKDKTVNTNRKIEGLPLWEVEDITGTWDSERNMHDIQRDSAMRYVLEAAGESVTDARVVFFKKNKKARQKVCLGAVRRAQTGSQGGEGDTVKLETVLGEIVILLGYLE